MKNKILSILLFFTLSLTFAQVPSSEKDALMTLYNATNGSSWYNDMNWSVTNPVATFRGITVENINGQDHVTEIDLYFNNLTGTLPTELQNLPFLTSFSVANNNISGLIPDLTGLTALEYFNISRNNFQFINFENEFINYVSNINRFIYSPMRNLENEIIYDIVIGNNYTMTMPTVIGTNVTYQWYKNDNPIIGETGLTYTINNAQISNAANYTCKASSPIVNNLTIDRRVIHIYAPVSTIEKNALLALYNATDGNNWNNNMNWNSSSPVYTWYGIKIEGNKVSEIDLYHNNLTGIIPPEIGNLIHLKSLIFWDNNLTGIVPVELGNCTNLKTLSLEVNALTGTIPVQLSNCTLMDGFFINGNQFSGELPDFYSSWQNLRHFVIGLYDSESNYGITGTIDLSNNSNLKVCWVSNTNISKLNIQNGNNINIYRRSFRAKNNPSLNCVLVDDVNYSTTNWLDIDNTATFVANQTECNILDVNDLIYDQNIIVYPNPANDLIYVEIKDDQQLKSIQIISLLGKEILNTTSLKIDASRLSKGLYFILINTDKTTYNKKILIN